MPAVVPRSDSTAALPVEQPATTALKLLIALSVAHLLNDTMQSLLPAIYPLLKNAYHLSFTQIGLITLTNQATASLLQPVVGTLTDRRPKPFSLAVGMGFTLVGLILLAMAGYFWLILVAAVFIGLGSSVFHPEASRVARMASGGRHGFAQSIFQVGGNFGTSLGPLLAALILVPGKQMRVLWFTLLALTGIVLLLNVGSWYRRHLHLIPRKPGPREGLETLSRRRIGMTISILVALVFSKYFYLACMTSYYTFFLIEKFKLSVQAAVSSLSFSFCRGCRHDHRRAAG